MANRLTVKELHDRIGITPNTPGYGVVFGPRSRVALRKAVTNFEAPGLTECDFIAFASNMNLPIGHVKGIRKVEAPRGAFTSDGIVSMLYERHVAYRNSDRGAFLAKRRPDLFAKTGYGRGGYGVYSIQFDKVIDACAYDPEAAFAGASWGAFQVLGENARPLGYKDPLDMVMALSESEAAHLDCFRRFIEWKRHHRTKRPLIEHLRECRPDDPDSCIPFVEGYNGTGFRKFDYHKKLAAAISV